ncbi:hypothetical protein AAHE18_16G220500 [Arachis hypogaea]
MHYVFSSEASSYQGVSFPSPLNGVVIFVISTLGGYLQVRFQSKNVSPFEEHYQIMWAASMVLSLYSIMLIGEFNLEVFSQTVDTIRSYFSREEKRLPV